MFESNPSSPTTMPTLSRDHAFGLTSTSVCIESSYQWYTNQMDTDTTIDTNEQVGHRSDLRDVLPYLDVAPLAFPRTC